MFLVTGITGKVGGATAEHLLAHGKKVRALVRNREKAAHWANQGVELVDGDWNDSAAIEHALKGVEGAFVMLPAVWAPSPDFKEARGVIANYVEALTRASPPRVVALSSMGANRTSGLGMITPPSEQNFVCRGEDVSFFEFGDTANSFARLTHKSGGRRLEAVLVRFPPYQSGPADMPTSAEEEFLYVTSGEISLTLEDKTFVLRTGDCAHYQSTLPQGWLNNQSTEALAIWVGTPNLL